jgi:hypothetical protein
MKKLFYILIGLGFACPTLAQEVTLTPTIALSALPESSPITQNETVLLFPETVYTRVGVALPQEQIATITLTIGFENSPPLVIQFPSQRPFDFSDDFVVASVDVPIPTQPFPPLFSNIRVQWQVVTRDNQVFATNDLVVYEDSRVQFVEARNDAETLNILMADSIGRPQTLLFNLDPIAERLTTETNITPRLNLLVYPTDVPIGCALNEEGNPVHEYIRDGQEITTPCNPELANRVYQEAGYDVLQAANLNTLQTVLEPQLVSQAYSQLWDNREIPAWFRIGMEQLYLTTQPNAIEPIRQRLRFNQVYSLEQMQVAPTTEPELSNWRNQAVSMVIYMMDTFGVESVFELSRALVNTPFNTAYSSITQQPLDTLLPSWRTWVYSNRAELAQTYRIYFTVTLTPVPTETATRTPLPPTVTETPSPTIAVTATLRPTRTPVPPTATITPLPAGSFLVRETATPTLPPTNSNTLPINPTQGLVLVVAGVLIVLILLGGWWFSRRNRD